MMLSTFGDAVKPRTHDASAAFCTSMSARRSASSRRHADCAAERLRFEADLSMCPPLVRPLGVLMAGTEDWTFSNAGLRGMLKSALSREGLHIRSAALKLPASVSRVS